MWALHGRNQVFILYPHSPLRHVGAQLKLEWPWNWWGHLFLHEGLARPQSWWVGCADTCHYQGPSCPPSRGSSGPDPVQMVGSRGKGRNGINQCVLCPRPQWAACPVGLAGQGCCEHAERMPRVFLQRSGYLENTVAIALGSSSIWSMMLCDHHFTAFTVPSEIKAGSPFMTPDAT